MHTNTDAHYQTYICNDFYLASSWLIIVTPVRKWRNIVKYVSKYGAHVTLYIIYIYMLLCK